ncbi:MAG: hypothetical protein ABSG46_00145 [Candidatus Binataceae bacterium]|jgi:hypothetical protein
MDPATIAASTVAALLPYLAAAAKKTAEKAGEAAYEGGAKLLAFLKGKLTGENERKALARVESNPENADRQAALRVELEDLVERDAGFGGELETLLKALPKTEATQSANVLGDNNTVTQAAGQNIHINYGERK